MKKYSVFLSIFFASDFPSAITQSVQAVEKSNQEIQNIKEAGNVLKNFFLENSNVQLGGLHLRLYFNQLADLALKYSLRIKGDSAKAEEERKKLLDKEELADGVLRFLTRKIGVFWKIF